MAFNACVALPLTDSQLFLVSSMRVCSGFRSSVACNLRFRRVKGDAVSIGSRFRNFGVARAKGQKIEDHSLLDDSMDNTDDEQVGDVRPKVPERDFTGTAYVPVYVMLPLSVIDMNCELVDPEDLLNQLSILKSANVDGVMIDCWWGIVEAHAPQVYKWSGYRRLFQMVRDLKLKLQVVMSFHECGGNVGDDVHIPLPQWVTEIGETNPDIYFTDREERRNTECLTWGIDKERVLKRRTAVEVYFDYMRSFRVEFDEFFQDGIISEIEIGLGPCGELRYPSYPAKHGWTYPGIGEFQCYDKYLMNSLSKAAEVRGHLFWGRGPENAGSYNSAPHEIGFFRDGGDYDSYYGRFFLNWYSQVLIDHGDRVLALANLAFEGTGISVKLSGIHWWYKTASHAAELTAGFYNSSNRDGYATIAAMLRKHGVALNFTCFEMRTVDQYEGFPEALADPEGLVWQVLNAAWDACIPLASENALPCYDREGYNKILENAKPLHNPDGRHLSVFTYLRLGPVLMERHNFQEFERFVKRMHVYKCTFYQTDDFDSSSIQFQEKQFQIQMQYEQKLHYSRGDGWVKLRLGVLSHLDRLYFLRVCPMSITYNVVKAARRKGEDKAKRAALEGNQGGARRSKPLKEKERTKLRERHRRAITARILAGLRRHGNYNLRARADINDVIAALAREAGWVVLPDGTTFPSRFQGSRPAGGTSAAITSSSSHLVSQLTPPGSLRGVSPGHRTSVDYNSCRMKGVFIPNPSPYDLSASTQSQTPGMVGEGREQTESDPRDGGSMNTINDKQIVDIPPIPKLPEQDFAGSPFIPVYVMLPLGAINMKCELVDLDGQLKQLKVLKSANVDGVMVDCWWGIVEAHAPQEYNWNGYKRLFEMVHELKLKLQQPPFSGTPLHRLFMIISIHVDVGGMEEDLKLLKLSRSSALMKGLSSRCHAFQGLTVCEGRGSIHLGNVGDDVCIPLPNWVAEIGRSNPDIFFTDREGRRNPECLSWGIDKELVLRGRTAIELMYVYFDYMRSFRAEFDEFFEDGIISMVEVGLGPCRELRYPSCPVKHGWRYPGIGEFVCYDKYFLKSLKKTAEARGHPFWARGPDNAGSYNSQPHETGFFCDGGEYDGYYGRFFLNWYARILVDHGDWLLGIHWWYKTSSHAAELTAGLYNPCNHDGYAAIVAMLKKHRAVLNFSCSELWTVDQQVDFAEAHADPEGLVWHVLNAAWDVGIPVAGENALPCYDRVTYNKILDNAKPLSDPDGRHFLSFTYLRLSPLLMERQTYMEFERFVKRMHGDAVLDLQGNSIEMV
ncbi:hypothetical protein POTOM_048005 [Populus tomentosa]|uniref:Beta-amylase n=1 Tax=Populus tomentosa TaxID=118781 RepID=A0A8X8CCT2_POPTO|nr:hypothetical protein POTOM_048005 [Populus tomentosa]